MWCAGPSWIIKCLVNKKLDHDIFTDITLELSNEIGFSKAKHHESLPVKLNDPKTTPKTSWSILKTFANGSKNPLIVLHLVDDEFVTEFLEKANMFNDGRFERTMKTYNKRQLSS